MEASLALISLPARIFLLNAVLVLFQAAPASAQNQRSNKKSGPPAGFSASSMASSHPAHLLLELLQINLHAVINRAPMPGQG